MDGVPVADRVILAEENKRGHGHVLHMVNATEHSVVRLHAVRVDLVVDLLLEVRDRLALFEEFLDVDAELVPVEGFEFCDVVVSKNGLLCFVEQMSIYESIPRNFHVAHRRFQVERRLA